MDRPARTLAGEGDEPAQAWNRPVEAGAAKPRIVERDPDDHARPGIHGRGLGRRYDAGRAAIARPATLAPGRSDSATRQHDPPDRRGHNRRGHEARDRARLGSRTKGRDPLARGRAPRTGDHRDADVRRRRPDQSPISVRARLAHHFRAVVAARARSPSRPLRAEPAGCDGGTRRSARPPRPHARPTASRVPRRRAARAASPGPASCR